MIKIVLNEEHRAIMPIREVVDYLVAHVEQYAIQVGRHYSAGI